MTAPDDDTFPPVRPPRQPKPITPGSSSDRFKKVRGKRRELDSLRAEHLSVGTQVLSAGGGNVFVTDMAVMAMLQRSYGVLDALIDAVDNYNVHAAAPLLRLQLDTLFRVSYMASLTDTENLAMRLLAGEEFRKMKDSVGKNLTDARLQALASTKHEWALAVYRETSGWVHFSLNHMKATTQAGDGGSFFMSIPLRANVLPETLWLELYDAAARATKEIFSYALGWAESKISLERET